MRRTVLIRMDLGMPVTFHGKAWTGKMSTLQNNVRQEKAVGQTKGTVAAITMDGLLADTIRAPRMVALVTRR